MSESPLKPRCSHRTLIGEAGQERWPFRASLGECPACRSESTSAGGRHSSGQTGWEGKVAASSEWAAERAASAESGRAAARAPSAPLGACRGGARARSAAGRAPSPGWSRGPARPFSQVRRGAGVGVGGRNAPAPPLEEEALLPLPAGDAVARPPPLSRAAVAERGRGRPSVSAPGKAALSGGWDGRRHRPGLTRGGRPARWAASWHKQCRERPAAWPARIASPVSGSGSWLGGGWVWPGRPGHRSRASVAGEMAPC